MLHGVFQSLFCRRKTILTYKSRFILMSAARLFLCFHCAAFRVPPYEGKLTIYGIQQGHIILIPLESFYFIPVVFLQLKVGV